MFNNIILYIISIIVIQYYYYWQTHWFPSTSLQFKRWITNLAYINVHIDDDRKT